MPTPPGVRPTTSFPGQKEAPPPSKTCVCYAADVTTKSMMKDGAYTKIPVTGNSASNHPNPPSALGWRVCYRGSAGGSRSCGVVICRVIDCGARSIAGLAGGLKSPGGWAEAMVGQLLDEPLQMSQVPDLVHLGTPISHPGLE